MLKSNSSKRPPVTKIKWREIGNPGTAARRISAAGSYGFHVFLKSRGRDRLGAFSQGFANPLLQPERRRLKPGGKLRQPDS